MITIDLHGRRLRMRRAHPDDAAASFGWFADPAVTRYLPLAGKAVLPLSSIQAHLEQVASSDHPKLSVTFELEGHGPVGCGGFRDFTGGSAEVSVVMGVPALWGQGLGAEALELLLLLGFGELGLADIRLVVRADNTKAVNLFGKYGFEIVGRQIAAVVVDEVARDKLTMQLSCATFHEGMRSRR